MEEISTVVGEKEHPSWDDLQKMTLVRNCAKEAMRIYSAGGILARTVPDDTQLLGYEVPGRVSFDVLLMQGPLVCRRKICFCHIYSPVARTK